MSSEARPRSRLALAVAVALVAIIGAGLGAGYYFAAASTPSFPVSWSVRPLMIKFNTSDGFSGSAPDSFTCSPDVSPVTLQAFSSQPDFITITVSPSSFSTCGSTPDNVVVTAACTAAHLDRSCDGDLYTGTVEVCGPAPYTCLKQFLAVTVGVTTHK
jgi:hypothetical protein